MVALSRQIAADHDGAAPFAGEHLAATQILVGLIGSRSRMPVPVVQIAGLAGGEGVTTVADSLARAIKTSMGVGVQHVMFSKGVADLKGGSSVARDSPRAEDDRLGSGVQRVVLPVSAIPRIISHGLDAEIGPWPSAVRLILVETPPILSSVEGAAMSGRVDGTILVAGADSSTYTAAHAGRDVVKRVGGRVLGIVLNKRRYRVPGIVARALGIPAARTGGLRRALLLVLLIAALVLAYLYLKSDDPEGPGWAQRLPGWAEWLPFAAPDAPAPDGTGGDDAG